MHHNHKLWLHWQSSTKYISFYLAIQWIIPLPISECISIQCQFLEEVKCQSISSKDPPPLPIYTHHCLCEHTGQLHSLWFSSWNVYEVIMLIQDHNHHPVCTINYWSDTNSCPLGHIFRYHGIFIVTNLIQEDHKLDCNRELGVVWIGVKNGASTDLI